MITDKILRAKCVSGLSYSQIAQCLNIDEYELTEVIYRRTECSMTIAMDLAQLLNQPKESFKALSHEVKTPVKPELLRQIYKSVAEKIVIGVIASIIIFTFQHNQNAQQRYLERAASSANAISSMLSDRADHLISYYRDYTNKVREIIYYNIRRATTDETLHSEVTLRELEQSIRTSIDVISPFSKRLQGEEKVAEIFLSDLTSLTRTLEARSVPDDVEVQLMELGNGFREVIEAIQFDVLTAIENEYQLAKGE